MEGPSTVSPNEAKEAILALAIELFGRPGGVLSQERFWLAAKERRLSYDYSPGQYHNLLDQSPKEWLEIWNLWAKSLESQFFQYPAQLKVLGDLVAEWALFAPERRLKVLVLGSGDGREAASVAMTLASLGLKAKGWAITIYGLELIPKLLATAKAGLYGGEALTFVPKEMARRFFRARGGAWRFQTNLDSLVYLGLNPHRLEAPPPEILGADVVVARGLTNDSPDAGVAIMVERLKPVFNEECLILTAPGEFWPNLSDFNLEAREGVTYYHRLAKRSNPKPLKKKTPIFAAPSSLSPPLQSLFWLAEDKLGAAPAEAKVVATELIHEEALLGYLNPDSIELIVRAETELNRPHMARVTAEVLAFLRGADL
ncbi:MAG: hypothetical protein LBI10_12905 [Deltaproteobacteria bacterium]|jgi:chemotaxis methyl-accepting protein methylase|nr:hypothetical protein [Deltaproteobacteria bacterium]